MVEVPHASRAIRWLLYFIIAVGALLRARAYFANRSLWLDELYLWTTLGPSAPATFEHWLRFLKPLGEGQVTAPGFVLLIQVVRAIFGDSEYALRLLPFLAGLATLPLSVRLFSRILGPPGSMLAVGAIAFAPSAIYYSADFKPYSLDLLVTLGVLDLVVSRFSTGRSTIDTRLWIAGSIAVFVSLPAILVLAGVGAAFVLEARLRSVRTVVSNLIPIGTWVLVFVVQLTQWMSHTHENRYLREYWTQERAFPPADGGSARLVWSFEAMFRALADPTGLTELWGRITWVTYLAAIFACAGVVVMLRSNRRLAFLVLVPIGSTLLAAHLERYPFQGRVICFLAPLFLVCVSSMVDALHRIDKAALRAVAWTSVLILLARPVIGAMERLRTPQIKEGLPVFVWVERRNDVLSPSVALERRFEHQVQESGASNGGKSSLNGSWAMATIPGDCLPDELKQRPGEREWDAGFSRHTLTPCKTKISTPVCLVW